jgi:predicted transcriptional regulator
MSARRPSPDFRSEERLIPMIRARLAERLVREGFRPKEVAASLNVTQAAVTQYLKRNRGGNTAASRPSTIS